jgi:hypothetical protein
LFVDPVFLMAAIVPQVRSSSRNRSSPDSVWPEIAASELGAKRGGGMASFFFRTKLTIPASAAGFDTPPAR